MTENSIELTEHHVSKCLDCRLRESVDGWPVCNHPDADPNSFIDISELMATPDWCPLRARPLLVKLVTP